MYSWNSLVPLLTASQCSTSPPLSSPTTPHSAPPVSGGVGSGSGAGTVEPRHSDDLDGENVDLQGGDEDDDVFEPEVPAESGALDTAAVGKRRTQSLSALQSSKEPQSPQKVQTTFNCFASFAVSNTHLLTSFDKSHTPYAVVVCSCT